ncbi:amidohydrolase [Microbacterium sp. No. 7]|uniref:amidohydrolase n=1 Tax=Microbacterium sp. No. 7 TaxID=1714373 RepID=UPI0006D21B56|nr:amidohydrolase [Microbacterium sp. No. 7]ALJ19904.1 hypothetical protein AOA12_08290 [Microbacterium sp. No. 7]
MTQSTKAPSVSGIGPLIAELAPRFIWLSDDVWDHPELRWEEHASVAAHIAAAEEFGARIEPQAGGVPTAFRAEWGSGGPVIAFLGEYDALAGLSQAAGSAVREPDPQNVGGAGQGCGHNLLGAGALLAAVATARRLEELGLPGTVRYYGCPAEEGAAGKSFMVAGGAFDGIDAAVTWHPADVMSTSQVRLLAYTQAYFRFTGLAAHAAAVPHLGRSALDAAELMNTGVNYLREHIRDDERIHYAFTNAGGTSPNVVQASAELYYIVRSPTVAGMRTLYDRVVRVAHGAAWMTETEVEVVFDGASAQILPNRVLEEALHRNVEVLGGVPFDDEDQAAAREIQATFPPDAVDSVFADHDLENEPQTLFTGVLPLADERRRLLLHGSSDVGDVSWTAPTVQIWGGTAACGTPMHSWQMVAQGKSAWAHKGMVHAATAIAATALDLFTDEGLLEAAKEEFAALTARTPYDCPIPEGTAVPPLRPGYRPA